MKNVTLADIARITGYSINTVSHALNNRSDISEKTKRYIAKTAEEIGYIANVNASALRSGKSKSVAIIVGDISNPHFSIMIKEIEERLCEYEYNAIIMNTDEDETKEFTAIKSAISKNVDGIIICPAQKSRANVDFLNKSGMPYILIGRHFDDKSTSYVVCDDVNGGFAAAEYFIKKGHKKILFLNAPLYISSAKERLKGIKKAFESYNCNMENLLYKEISTTENTESMLKILEKNRECTAIICFSDLVGMQVCNLLKRENKEIPHDISVMGFDNIASKFMFPLMLTSVTSSKTKMSISAVKGIMGLINGENSSYQVVLETKVVEREST